MKYKHIEYSVSVPIKRDKETPLPQDKRRIPYPSIRKYKLKDVISMEDFNIKMMAKICESSRKIMERNALQALLGNFKRG